MIKLKTQAEIDGIRVAGEILVKTLHAVREIIRPGVTTNNAYISSPVAAGPYAENGVHTHHWPLDLTPWIVPA